MSAELAVRLLAAGALSRPSEDAAPYPGRLAGQAVCADCGRSDVVGLEVVGIAYPAARGPIERVCSFCRHVRLVNAAVQAIEYERAKSAARAEWDHFAECLTCEKRALEGVAAWARRALCPMRRSA